VELSFIPDWGGKLPGAVARVAALLHMFIHVDNAAPWEIPISTDTVKRAIQIGQYLIDHARVAYASIGADPAVADAEYVLAWVKGTGNTSFSRRDAHQELRGRFKRVADIKPALTLLCEHGFLRPQVIPPSGGSGRPRSPVYEVNPAVPLSQNPHNPQNESILQLGRNFEDCEDSENSAQRGLEAKDVRVEKQLANETAQNALAGRTGPAMWRAHGGDILLMVLGVFDEQDGEVYLRTDFGHGGIPASQVEFIEPDRACDRTEAISSRSDEETLQGSAVPSQDQISPDQTTAGEALQEKHAVDEHLRRKDATQAYAARQAIADGDYSRARGCLSFIRDRALRDAIEAEIVQVEAHHVAEDVHEGAKSSAKPP
jgi:hypothetical protein